MKKIGMRNIKTALAVCICILTLGYFKKSFPFFACIAAIITMDNTIYNSFEIGKNRIIGTFLGALIGLIFSLVFPSSKIFVVVIIFLGISMTIYLCDILGYQKSISIACIVFMSIVNNTDHINLLTYSFNRLSETIYGILIAVLINYIIYPPNLKKQIFDSSKTIHMDLILICGKDFYNNNKLRLENLYSHIKDLESSIVSYEDEYKSYNHTVNIKKYKYAISLFYNLYIHLVVIEDIKHKVPIPDEIYKDIHSLTSIAHKDINLAYNEENFLTSVFNYHMKKIKDILEKLDEISML